LIDIKLIEECRDGNFNNFRKLVELTSPYLFSVAFRILGEEDQAKDAVQEALVTIWQKLGAIKSASAYKSWAYKVVINKCYDELRSRKRNPEHTSDEKSWAILSEKILEMPSSQFENDETARIIRVLTNKLSPRQKAVFVLSDLEEMTSDEISEITGLNKSNIKANLHYARKSIAEMIEKYL
jgi:RNA polymerase sigma-70 factor, ECF subfamily